MNFSAAEPIDAVITWVDGRDPMHVAKRNYWLNNNRALSNHSIPAGYDETRFLDNGEIYYCIRSIRKFAPWIRFIYLVTDSQVPAFLSAEAMDKYRVRIVDHKVIFKGYESALPTFNSRSIETLLWKIPGISEKFIYFNDDFVLLQDVSQSDFFMGEKVVLHGSWVRSSQETKLRLALEREINRLAKSLLGVNRTSHLLAQKKGARIAGFDNSYYRVPHVPHPLRVSTLSNYFSKNRGFVDDNISYKFRSTDQFWLVSLANHLEISIDNAVFFGAGNYVAINAERQIKGSIKKSLEKIKRGQTSFLSISGMESLDRDTLLSMTKILDELIFDD